MACAPDWRAWCAVAGCERHHHIWPPPEKRGSPLASFNVEGIHATDLSTFLDFEGAQALTRVPACPMMG